MKRALAAFVLCVVWASPARGDLRYAAHLESADLVATTPVPAQAGARRIGPAFDKVDAVVTMSTDAARIVYATDVLFVPQGAAIVRHVTGGFIVNSRDRTFSIVDTRMALASASQSASFIRTGEIEDIAGVPAERVTVDIVRSDSLRFGGEIWLTGRFAAYQKIDATIDTVTTLLSHETGWPGGFILRADLSGPALGDRHMIKSVVSISEIEPQPEAFAIPEGYRQIPVTSQAPHVPAIVRAGVHEPGEPGVVSPKPLNMPKPSYTREAMAQGISGVARVAGIVETDGRVHEAKIVKSLDAVYGLDDSALKNVKEWRFTPGTFNGSPAPILVSFDISFSTDTKPRK